MYELAGLGVFFTISFTKQIVSEGFETQYKSRAHKILGMQRVRCRCTLLSEQVLTNRDLSIVISRSIPYCCSELIWKDTWLQFLGM